MAEPSAGAENGFAVRSEEVRKVVGNVSALLVRGMAVVRDLNGLSVPPSAFAEIGSEVAAANDGLREHLDRAFGTLLRGWQQVNQATDDDACTYRRNDQNIAGATGGVARSFTPLRSLLDARPPHAFRRGDQ
jgi:hypothetical protein